MNIRTVSYANNVYRVQDTCITLKTTLPLFSYFIVLFLRSVGTLPQQYRPSQRRRTGLESSPWKPQNSQSLLL